MVCCVLRLSSASLSNAPQRVRSFGIGLAATHLALTNWLKSVHASVGAPSSLTSKMLLLSAAAVLPAAAGAVLAVGAGVSAGVASCLPQALTVRARLTAGEREGKRRNYNH